MRACGDPVWLPDLNKRKALQVEQQYEDDWTAQIEITAERYWLQGMDLGYSKRRAIVEHAQQEAQLQGYVRAAARGA